MPRTNVAIGIIATLHLVFALIYASVTPYRQGGAILGQRGAYAADIGAPDERQHANYVARIAHGEGIPVFNPKDPNLYDNYQAHQPPLYYLLAGTWAKAIGADATKGEDGVKVRALNTIIGASTVLAVYCLALWGLGSSTTALGAATMVAFLPMNCALSGAISNDPLLISLCTWTLAFATRGVRDGWCAKIATLCGLLTALAILTKTTGVALLPVLLVAALMRRPKPLEFAAVLLPILVFVTPWWMRNQSLYGDPLAIGAFNQAFTGSPQASQLISVLGASTYWGEWVGWWTARSFVGVFGYMDIWLTNTGTRNGANGLYQIVLLMLGIGILGWIGALAKAASTERRVLMLNLAFGVIVLLLFARFNAQYFQAQARYLFPALGPVALAVAAGYTSLLQKRPQLLLVIIAAPLLLANLFALSKLPSEFAIRLQPPRAGNTP